MHRKKNVTIFVLEILLSTKLQTDNLKTYLCSLIKVAYFSLKSKNGSLSLEWAFCFFKWQRKILVGVPGGNHPF